MVWHGICIIGMNTNIERLLDINGFPLSYRKPQRPWTAIERVEKKIELENLELLKLRGNPILRRFFCFLLVNGKKFFQRDGQRKRKFKTMVYAANFYFKKKSKLTVYQLTALDLWKIAKRQKLKCALTGVKLDSYNISLDHIIPISRGGTNEPSNIQLIQADINSVKFNFLMPELIEIVKSILKHCDPKTLAPNV